MMTLSDFLVLVVRFTYALLGLITLLNLLRHRDQARLDIALMFSSLAVAVLGQQYSEVTGQNPVWLTKLEQVSVMAQPFLQLQLVEHFRPVATWVRLTALAGLAASVALLLLIPTQALPTPITLFLIVYFVVVEAYATLAFIQGGLQARGVARQRMLLAASGSGLLASIILLAGINLLVPPLEPWTELLSRFLSVLSGLAYYLGFAPPRWLRRAWQLDELHHFLRDLANKPADRRGRENLPHLCEAAVRAVGGRAAVAALWDDVQQQLVIQATTHPALTGTLSSSVGATGRAWQSRQPAQALFPAEFSPEGARLASMLKARALLVVPIATPERTWGVLAVFLQHRPLFAADDRELVSLFAEQSTLALEQAALVVEQQNLVEHLRQRTSQLEAANHELEAFSYSVSHDLRAPLRHIEGFTNLLLKNGSGAASDKSRRHLQLIAEAAVRMGGLIDHLLAFSRLGQTVLHRQTVALDQVVEDARRELQADMEGRDIDWQIRPLPLVHGDPALLRLVFVNLISNALKYSRSRPQARIEIGTEPNRGGQAIIYVRDNGIGFDMQYVDKLFGVFQRLQHADEFEGLGIGLANVRRIVHRHDGHTWAEGVLDGGATFYLSLPLPPDPPAQGAPVSGALKPETL